MKVKIFLCLLTLVIVSCTTSTEKEAVFTEISEPPTINRVPDFYSSLSNEAVLLRINSGISVGTHCFGNMPFCCWRILSYYASDINDNPIRDEFWAFVEDKTDSLKLIVPRFDHQNNENYLYSSIRTEACLDMKTDVLLDDPHLLSTWHRGCNILVRKGVYPFTEMSDEHITIMVACDSVKYNAVGHLHNVVLDYLYEAENEGWCNSLDDAFAVWYELFSDFKMEYYNEGSSPDEKNYYINCMYTFYDDICEYDEHTALCNFIENCAIDISSELYLRGRVENYLSCTQFDSYMCLIEEDQQHEYTSNQQVIAVQQIAPHIAMASYYYWGHRPLIPTSYPSLGSNVADVVGAYAVSLTGVGVLLSGLSGAFVSYLWEKGIDPCFQYESSRPENRININARRIWHEVF